MFEDALAGVAAGRAGDFGYVVGVDRVGQATRCASTAPTSSSRTWPSCWRRYEQRMASSRSSRGPCARRGSTSDVLAQTESVFALSNGHIGLRANLDEGEPFGLPART